MSNAKLLRRSVPREVSMSIFAKILPSSTSCSSLLAGICAFVPVLTARAPAAAQEAGDKPSLSTQRVVPGDTRLARPTPATGKPAPLDALYRKSIDDAAVKRKSYLVPLTPMTPGTPIAVATFATDKSPPIASRGDTLLADTWVSIVPYVQQICQKRSGNPIVRIEQILGMPPRGNSAKDGQWMMYQFTVQPSDVFRPCASSAVVDTTACSFTPSSSFSAETAFVFNQMWTSYMIGVDGPGYPFTGMGWTYDWSPQAAPGHIGVSEYVVHAGATVTNILPPVKAAALCSTAQAAR
jgi:hypothetical protein